MPPPMLTAPGPLAFPPAAPPAEAFRAEALPLPPGDSPDDELRRVPLPDDLPLAALAAEVAREDADEPFDRSDLLSDFLPDFLRRWDLLPFDVLDPLMLPPLVCRRFEPSFPLLDFPRFRKFILFCLCVLCFRCFEYYANLFPLLSNFAIASLDENQADSFRAWGQ